VQRLPSQVGRRSIVFGEPKTERGRRDVPIPRELRDQLRPLIISLDSAGLVFPQPTRPDVPLDYSEFGRKVFRPALRALGLPDLRLYDLRHSAITAWLEEDRLSLQVVSAMAGHANVAFTLERYGHLLRGWQTGAAEAMDARARAVT
jgi:integrase